MFYYEVELVTQKYNFCKKIVRVRYSKDEILVTRFCYPTIPNLSISVILFIPNKLKVLLYD